MKRLAIALAGMGALLASCGGGTPCKGSTCINVAGSYSVTATSAGANNCIFGSESGSEFFVITQSESDLTLQGDVSAKGTLDTNKSASFATQQVIKDPGCTSPVEDCFDFNVNTSINLNFDGKGGFTGSEEQTVVSTNGHAIPGSTSTTCTSSFSLTGTLGN
jgi:hypothetical protein